MITKAVFSSVIALAVGGALCDPAAAQMQYPLLRIADNL